MGKTPAERLVGEYFERVRSYVRMRVPERDCEDVVAEVFLRALARHRQVRRNDPGAWLFAVARSQVVQFYRNRVRREKEHVMHQGEPGQRTPLEELEVIEFGELLRRKMSVLSELEREAVALKFTDGLTNARIARMLSVAPNSLGVLLHRALKKLRHAMQEEA